jgi:hypothetical protein
LNWIELNYCYYCCRIIARSIQITIVTYKVFAWRIITGSGLDGWVYWHFFTITANYSSLHIELLLNPLANELRLLSDECSEESLKFTNELPFITSIELNRDHRLQGFHYCVSWMRYLGNVHEPLPRKIDNSVSGSTIPAFRRCLPSRCLANGHIPSHYCPSFTFIKPILYHIIF